MKNGKQHVQVPNNMTGIDLGYFLVYATLKKFMNNVTKECFPSLETLSKASGYSINTVKKALTVLQEKGYISIRREGRKNVYKIFSYTNFEPFSYVFLESENLESNEKAYVIACQKFLFTDQKGFGKLTYSNEQMAEKLNVSTRTIERYDKSLIDKGYLTVIKTKEKDLVTGLCKNEKIFHLDEMGQSIIWTLQKHNEQIEENSKDIKVILNYVTELKEENELLRYVVLKDKSKEELEEIKKNINKEIIL